jgi:chemotaxis protein CheD
VLGSCISVVLLDQRLNYCGMNHFMLPSTTGAKSTLHDESGKYGMYAMELLIGDMVKKGSRRDDLCAKVFGGGHVLVAQGNNATVMAKVPANNIIFAYEYLDAERIPVVSADTGGNHGRKIYVYTIGGKVLLKRLNQEKIAIVAAEEAEYAQKIDKPQKGGVTFF